MQKQAWTWTTPRLPQPARMARWGHFGAPVLIFPTAGGDFEEIERFQLIAALGELINGGQIKVYSIDGIAVRAWLSGQSPSECASLQIRYDTFVYEEVLQRIRQDCHDNGIEPTLVGASFGAATALNVICRHPESFRAAIGLSGVYGLTAEPWGMSNEITAISPASYLSALEEPRLERLRHRPIILGSGEGDYEHPADSKRMSEVFASKNVPCRLSLWGPSRDHTWSTWREMLPRLLADQLADQLANQP